MTEQDNLKGLSDDDVLAIEKVKHDSKCSVSWSVPDHDCCYALLLRNASEDLKNGLSSHIIYAVRHGNLSIDHDNRPHLAPAFDVETQERMKAVYLRNHGVRVALKSLDELGIEGITERIGTLDAALQDKAFCKIRAKKDSLQEAINKLRTIQQGVIICENQLLSKCNEAMRLMQERKDRSFNIPKHLASPGKASTQDILKAKEAKKEKAKAGSAEALASYGVNMEKLMEGLRNAGKTTKS